MIQFNACFNSFSPLMPPPMLRKLRLPRCRKASNNSLQSPLWFIMWWIISISASIPHAINSSNHPFIRVLSLVSFFTIFVLHHPKMFFIEIYSVITFSYPPPLRPRFSSALAIVCCWQRLSMARFVPFFRRQKFAFYAVCFTPRDE